VAEDVELAVEKGKEAPGGLASKKDGLRAAVLKAAASMASNAAAAKEAAASSEEEEEEEEKPKGEAGIAGEDFASRMKRQMQMRAARLGAAKGKGKTEKQISQMASQRMEEMIDFEASDEEDEEEGQKPKKSKTEQLEEETYAKVGKLNLKKIRKLKEETNKDAGFKIAGERTGAERREKRVIKKMQHSKEKDTLAKLKSFGSTLLSASRESSEATEDTEAATKKKEEAEVPKSWRDTTIAEDEEDEDDEEDDADWASHTLKFTKTAADRRREFAEMRSLETVDDRKPGEGDTRSFHERRLRPDGAKGGKGNKGSKGKKGGKGGGVNASRW